VRPQVDQLSLLHVGITKTEKNKTKRKVIYTGN